MSASASGISAQAAEQDPRPIRKKLSLLHSGQHGLMSEKIMQHTWTAENVKINRVHVHQVAHLRDFLDVESVPNKFFRTRGGDSGRCGFTHPIGDDQIVLADAVRREGLGDAVGFMRAGPRPDIVFEPSEVCAAIVTCGGLCPGMNRVITELVSMLYYNYSVDKIYGIRGGYAGFYSETLPPIPLLPDTAQTDNAWLHGGTLLQTSRGGFDLDKIMDSIEQHGFNQIYIIGGDGTHRGAQILHHECRRRKHKVCVVGVPKTIDNDIAVIDRSFGFNTAVEEANRAVQSVYTEARSHRNGVGVVTVMGRASGFIAANVTLASGCADLCLVPEVSFTIDEVVQHVANCLEHQAYCVIVLAEGAGQDLLKGEEEYDASGNLKLKDISTLLKYEIKTRLKKQNIELTIKDNEPKYMVRSVPASASDQVYCMVLAHNAVHGAMAGFTGFTSGLVNNRTCMLPISLVTALSPTHLDPHGRTWERVLRSTHQRATRHSEGDGELSGEEGS
ncbi:MAG: hypothetical protein MHM6MM_001223 [Cercozoa sp. M6MM]